MKRYVNATPSKRLGAFLLDAFCIIFSLTIFYSLLAQIFIRTPAFKEANEIINEILLDSHLYVYDENDTKTVVMIEEKDYAVAIEKYYIETKNDETTYNEKMTSSKLFDYVDGEYVKKEDVSDSSINDFYNDWSLEILKEIKSTKDYLFCYAVSMNYVFYNAFISSLLSYFTFIVIFPLIFKNRCTLGQKAMNLALVNSETYQVATRIQIIFRSFIILLVEIVLSCFSYGLPAIISIALILFGKDKMSYHDKLSNTKLIDYHYIELDDSRKKVK